MSTSKRAPVRALGVSAARAVRSQLGYLSPLELDLETLCHLRGVLVRSAPTTGARASLVRVGARGIIGVAAGLPPVERRWAIAHELGHFEAHANVSFLGLCSGDDLVPAYQASGREPEANAFAAELLMPEDLFAPRCDPRVLTWEPVRELAAAFQVSLTAAALRLLSFTSERAAVVCVKDRLVTWSSATRDFGPRPERGTPLASWDADPEAHVLAMPGLGIALHLLVWPIE